jgi:DNA repair exonuclease SbcCD ATPase subunit
MILNRLEIRNMRKVKQADIEFHGPGLQVIQGANKSGKSTLAQSIALTLEGPKSFTPGMITQGEEQAEIIAYSDDDGLQIRTVVRNTAKDAVKQTVSRMDPTIQKYVAVSGGVRAFLESIRSGLEMPWSMRDMTDARIIEILKNRAGISQKIAEIDSATKDKETARTEVGREKKRIGSPAPVKETKHPPAIDDIKAEREAAATFLKREREILDKAAEYIRGRCSFESLKDIEDMKAVIDSASKCAQGHFKEAGKPYTTADLDTMDNQFMDWTKEEERANAYDDYKNKMLELEELSGQYEALTQEIEALRESRKKALSGMNLKVTGLEIGEDNMLYHNGIVRGITETETIGNWSTAETVQVFFSIAARFSGDIKMLVVDNAESLDQDTTGKISKWAEESGFLVILLKVASIPEELEDGIIYVKEGEVITK